MFSSSLVKSSPAAQGLVDDPPVVARGETELGLDRRAEDGAAEGGPGLTLISCDAAAKALRGGTLEEWRCATLQRQRAWHVVARAGDELSPTARLFLSQLAERGSAAAGDRFEPTASA